MLKWAVFPKPEEFRKRVVGSDPRAATCRGKLQSKRSKLNMEINKELMLRSGAENLFKATTNKKMRETVALELSFVNSNLQLLKEQLAELNSSVELYQAGSQLLVPMIPLGLKETKEIELQEPFKDFILEHYSEDGGEHDESLAELQDLRQAMRTPTRDSHGISLLFQYYNHLYYIERRFFPPDRSLGIFFEWYDSLTGVPSSQRTVAFEKASVLFNIGGLYTQIGTRQDRGTEAGLDAAVDNFLRAAGTFQYIHENFTNAPSMDLGPETLQMLVQLMCGQARECLLEKSRLGFQDQKDRSDGEEESDEDDDDEKRLKPDDLGIDHCLELGQESAHVGEVYEKVYQAISQQQVKDYVPFSWVALIQVKREHYRALAHYYVAVGLLDHTGDLDQRTKDTLLFLHDTKESKLQLPETKEQRKYLGKAHLREALLLHEEAQRINRMCRELRKKDQLAEVLRMSRENSLNKYADIDDEDDFQEVLDPPPVLPSTTYQLTLSFPDTAQYRVTDLFKSLGPVAVFNAKHHWSAPRTIQLRKRDDEGYGFSVRGDAPVVIAGVEPASLAHIGGMKEGDYLVGIGDQDVKWSTHADVVNTIKGAGNSLKLRLVTPLNKAKTSFSKPKVLGGMSPTSTTSSSSGLSSAGSSYPSDSSGVSPPLSEVGSTRGNQKLNFSIFKKARDRRSYRDEFPEENISFR
ncbi:rhophilin-2 [Eurytemora carolleeae]|uniref:rhophilin-2 n=1 Tax=Eurytemora carolleeae TaxID=1294199 RepID=UPI000C77E2D6|nr:rhophilin-2 [Eurytemora carolleeae]|eukprot:XP_023343913.1 rhophilin-2-like [Eurytemora affinis]